MWTYATCCMSQPDDIECIELHMFSPIQSQPLVELLTVVSHFHRTGEALQSGDTVCFGRPWLLASKCDCGLISLPYLDGPAIEECGIPPSSKIVRCLWLVPITESERDFKREHGLEMLEKRFEETRFNYLDPGRMSVV